MQAFEQLESNLKAHENGFGLGNVCSGPSLHRLGSPLRGKADIGLCAAEVVPYALSRGHLAAAIAIFFLNLFPGFFDELRRIVSQRTPRLIGDGNIIVEMLGRSVNQIDRGRLIHLVREHTVGRSENMFAAVCNPGSGIAGLLTPQTNFFTAPRQRD